MRVPSNGIKTEKQIRNVQQTGSVKAGLKVGKRFSAVIVSVDGENVSLEVNGKLINARNASSDKLFSGSLAQFEVLKSSDETIEIRPIALSNLSSPENDFNYVKSTLNKLGISVSSDNIDILSQMMKTGVPVSTSTFTDAKQAFLSTQKLADALFSTQESKAIAQNENNMNLPDAKALIELLSKNAGEVIRDKNALSTLQDFVNKELLSEKAGQTFDNKGAGTESVEVDKGFDASAGKQGDKVDGLKSSNEANLVDGKNQSLNQGKDHGIKSSMDFVKDLMMAFKNLSSSRDNLINHTVFLNKLGIKPSVFNVAVTESLLKGELGFSKAMGEVLARAIEDPELLENKDLGDKIKNFLKSSMKMAEIPEKIDAKSIEENLKNFKLLNEELARFSMEHKDSKNVEQLGLLRQHANLIKEMEPIWQNVFMPILDKSSIDDIEMYVKRDGAHTVKNRNSEDRVIYLSLKTDRIERVKARIDYTARDLKLIFVLQNEDLKNYAENMIPHLGDRLRMISKKNIHIAVNSDSFDTNLLDFELVASFNPSSTIDMRV